MTTAARQRTPEEAKDLVDDLARAAESLGSADASYARRAAKKYAEDVAEAKAALLAALLKQSPEASGSYLSGWVIEGTWSPADRPEYWVGSSIWSNDPYKALRFATRESARQAADLMCAGVNVRIACHEWAREENHNEQ